MSLADSAPAILLNHLFCPKRIGLGASRCPAIFVLADRTKAAELPSSVNKNAVAYTSVFRHPFTTLTAPPVVLRHVPWQLKQSVAHDSYNLFKWDALLWFFLY